MFTLMQHLLGERILYGIISDVLFFVPLGWAVWTIRKRKVSGDGEG